jgi:molybdenum cofactor biosynthesis protein B
MFAISHLLFTNSQEQIAKIMRQCEHKKHLPHISTPLKFALIITSDTRTGKTDKSGDIIISLLEKARYKCVIRKIVKNNSTQIRSIIKKTSPNVQLIIISGGTGCGEKDITIESITPFLIKKLDGFGELFRMFSYKEIGSAAMMSRALLGITKEGKVICALPGSPNAVSLALRKLLIPELQHIIWELKR